MRYQILYAGHVMGQDDAWRRGEAASGLPSDPAGYVQLYGR